MKFTTTTNLPTIIITLNTKTQQTPQTVSTIKLPIRRMGNMMRGVSTEDDAGVSTEDAKFHKMTDAKEMWDAIKSRFGGNDESKKIA
ncbi:hypothetical protein Tco_1533592 [Tanacetum coccineum]